MASEHTGSKGGLPVVDERAAVLDTGGLDALITALREEGRTVVGPTVRDGAIVLDEVRSIADLPAGVGDEQDNGTYRLRHRGDAALFSHAVGAHSWKAYLFPPRTLLFQAERSGADFAVIPAAEEVPRFAFLGVRGCDLAAIAVQDRVFLGAHPDPTYAARRAQAFIVAVHCSSPASTCFCVSRETGPRAGPGYDLALTEVLDDGGHRFVVEVGSKLGAAVLEGLPRRPATALDREAAAAVVAGAEAAIGRSLPIVGTKERIEAGYESPRWDDVASRCLGCANCTMVCPTCFCSTVSDTTDLGGGHAERWRSWDSCFTLDFTELGDTSVRGSIRSRYRQWMTHKLATWFDQFDTSGCVGCGRCITWCPVGIDITEEARAL